MYYNAHTAMAYYTRIHLHDCMLYQNNVRTPTGVKAVESYCISETLGPIVAQNVHNLD